jgi:outer membrane protein assembly factor BamD
MRILTIVLFLSALAACSGDGDKKLKDDVRAPEIIYNEAQDNLEQGNLKTAAEGFLEVERDHPYSKWATQAQVQAAYAYYKNEKYNDAIDTLERFVKLNPGNQDVPYAYYLIALSYYNQISDVGRDQEMTMKAREALKNVATRYPGADYGKDAKFKLDLVEDHLAGKEMEVGRYYLKRRDYIAAVNRFKKVVTDYPTTAQAEEALYRLVEAYTALGITPEAQKYASVLGYNYPGGEWYKNAYELVLDGKEPVTSSGSKGSWYKFW